VGAGFSRPTDAGRNFSYARCSSAARDARFPAPRRVAFAPLDVARGALSLSKGAVGCNPARRTRRLRAAAADSRSGGARSPVSGRCNKDEPVWLQWACLAPTRPAFAALPLRRGLAAARAKRAEAEANSRRAHAKLVVSVRRARRAASAFTRARNFAARWPGSRVELTGCVPMLSFSRATASLRMSRSFGLMLTSATRIMRTMNLLDRRMHLSLMKWLEGSDFDGQRDR
jgi:hypothetical protein